MEANLFTKLSKKGFSMESSRANFIQGGILLQICSGKFCKIQRETPAPESLYDKIVGLESATYWKRNSGAGDFL